MDYQLAFDPGLKLRADEFAAAWNDDPACADAAQARVVPAPTTTYLPPEIVAAGITVLSGVALNLASDALYDLIKTTLARRGVKKTIEIKQLEQPDGAKLLVIRITEE